MRKIWFVGAAMIFVVSGGITFAEDAVDPAAVKSEDGKYFDKEGNPSATLMSAREDRLENWRLLQELAGIK